MADAVLACRKIKNYGCVMHSAIEKTSLSCSPHANERSKALAKPKHNPGGYAPANSERFLHFP
jgi:hypothetical protein